MLRRLAYAAVVLGLGFAAVAVPPGAAVAGELPIEVRVYASCDASPRPRR